MKTFTALGYECERCDWKWIPRDKNTKPKVCPKCKSAYWDRPRKGGIESE